MHDWVAPSACDGVVCPDRFRDYYFVIFQCITKLLYCQLSLSCAQQKLIRTTRGRTPLTGSVALFLVDCFA
jgi:hypothetical protein